MNSRRLPITERKVRFALVGCGSIANNHFDSIAKRADRYEPTVRPGRDCVWAQYTLPVSDRSRVQCALCDLNLQPAYPAWCGADCCPNSAQAGGQVMSLPTSADLAEYQQDRVAAALRRVWSSTAGGESARLGV